MTCPCTAPPLVSILIPACNAGRWLPDTLACALAQTWPATEIIVVDDGSTDDTRQIAERHVQDGVRVIVQANRGAAAARNTALRAARGDYLQFLDADDLLWPDKLARQMNRVQQLQQDRPDGAARILLSAAWGRFMLRPDHAVQSPDLLWQDLTPIDWLLAKFNRNHFMCPATWLVSRPLADAAGPWNETLSLDDDGEYACRLVAASQSVSFVADARCAYRIGNTDSLSSRNDTAALCSLLRSLSLCIDHLLTLENSPRTRSACVQLLQDNLALFHPEQAGLVANIQTLARNLGGRLTPPRERLHVSLFRQLFGHQRTRLARQGLNHARLQWRKALEQLPQFAAPHTGRHPSRS
jgi:hypothetical protein